MTWSTRSSSTPISRVALPCCRKPPLDANRVTEMPADESACTVWPASSPWTMARINFIRRASRDRHQQRLERGHDVRMHLVRRPGSVQHHPSGGLRRRQAVVFTDDAEGG